MEKCSSSHTSVILKGYMNSTDYLLGQSSKMPKVISEERASHPHGTGINNASSSFMLQKSELSNGIE